jgi:hypothetical protein
MGSLLLGQEGYTSNGARAGARSAHGRPLIISSAVAPDRETSTSLAFWVTTAVHDDRYRRSMRAALV